MAEGKAGKLILTLLILAAIGLIIYLVLSPKDNGTKEVKGDIVRGFVGSEKMEFLKDPDVQEYIADKYGIVIKPTKAGSLEMVQNPGNMEFLWPSSENAAEYYKKYYPGSNAKIETIFNTPIVLCSWDVITEGFIKAGIVKKIDNTYYIVDFARLINLVLEGKSWKDVGINELYGRITIKSTDPTKSNSGNLFMGLIGIVLNNGEIFDKTQIPKYVDRIKKIFLKMGYKTHSTGDLFRNYLTQGMGQYPLIVSYENLVLEFSRMYPQEWAKASAKVRILYPIPTVWSSHTLIVIAKNKRTQKLIEALKDPEVQKLGFERHGFRTAVPGVANNFSLFKALGVPEVVTKVVSLPDVDTMMALTQMLKSE